jgi:hypothetical protein
MGVYLLTDRGRHFMTADDPTEAHNFAARLRLPSGRLQLAGTPRWHWRLTTEDMEWAVTAGGKRVDLAVFRLLVAARQIQDGNVPAGVLVCGPPTRTPKYNPTLRRHSWVKDKEHWRHCRWCAVVTENVPIEHSGKWYFRWRWRVTAPGSWDGSTRDGKKLPTCPGQPPTAP